MLLCVVTGVSAGHKVPWVQDWRLSSLRTVACREWQVWRGTTRSGFSLLL